MPSARRRRPTVTPPRAMVLLLLGLLGLLGAGTSPAAAAPRTAREAASQAQSVLARVHDLQAQTDGAVRAYDSAVSAVAGSVDAGIRAAQAERDGADAAVAAQDRLDGRVRALYIFGGPAAMLSALLSADGLGDLTSRVVIMQHLVADGRDTVAADAAAADRARTHAASARAAALGSIGTAGDVLATATRLQGLLDEQRRVLASADATTRRLRATEAAAAALRVSRLAVARITAAATRKIAPLAGSAAYFTLYHAAAPTCPGLSWTVLAAIGQVESGHGRNAGTSSAGARGPMQFMPATFAAYAVDGNHDRRTDIDNPADAIYTAAHFLCVHGAGTGRAGVRRALLFYNHAGWYVDLVVALAARYGAGG